MSSPIAIQSVAGDFVRCSDFIYIYTEWKYRIKITSTDEGAHKATWIDDDVEVRKRRKSGWLRMKNGRVEGVKKKTKKMRQFLQTKARRKEKRSEVHRIVLYIFLKKLDALKMNKTKKQKKGKR